MSYWLDGGVFKCAYATITPCIIIIYYNILLILSLQLFSQTRHCRKLSRILLYNKFYAFKLRWDNKHSFDWILFRCCCCYFPFFIICINPSLNYHWETKWKKSNVSYSRIFIFLFVNWKYANISIHICKQIQFFFFISCNSTRIRRKMSSIILAINSLSIHNEIAFGNIQTVFFSRFFLISKNDEQNDQFIE